MQVTVLGTGSPNAPSVATGLVVRDPNHPPLVIDTCGGFEFYRQLLAAGIAIGSLRDIILTHRHGDHIGGMMPLFIAEQPLTIYAQPDTREAVDGLMTACYPEWPIHPEVEWIAIGPGARWEIAGYQVTFFETRHRVPTVAVRVETEGKVLAFSADGRPCQGMIDCARDADLFICDACYAASDGLQQRAERLMHPTGREAAEMANEAGARSLLLLHFSSRTNPAHVAAEAAEIFGGPLTSAEDGHTYEI
ncbi:MAG TPA: MBL fold metallo-hydrolase [Thermomicrobiaceae bacterium]|nr:MBL fold metallo-hydrolase [Thermomicrobiaceae bacterium]